MQQQNEIETNLLSMASQLLGLALIASEEISSEINIEEAKEAHATEKLYPKLIVTSPHGGGAIRIEVALCDPITDEHIYSLLSLEGNHEHKNATH